MDAATAENQPIELFISYTHKDDRLRKELETHLSALRRQGIVASWCDRRIEAGSEWAGQIHDKLNTAQVILLMISADFIASDYCNDVELKRAMERHNNSEAKVIPIFVRPCDWKGMPFGKLQGVPSDAKPVASYSSRDKAWTEVAQAIRRAVEGLRDRP